MQHAAYPRPIFARSFVVLVAVTLLMTIAVPVGAAHPFQTTEAPYITLVGGGDLIPIITVGDPDYHDVTFQGIPDGIGVRPGPTSDTVDVFVNHEETTVPFFGTADFQDASVTRWTLSTASGTEGEIVGAGVAIPSSDGFLRFCSASMAGPAEGFSTYTFFTGEETSDVVPVSPGAPDADAGLPPGMRQGGLAVVLNTDTGESTAVPGMGRLNHENTIALPGYNQLVMLTTDDTFDAPSSQLYMYLANHESHVWQDKGSLWAFQATSANGQKVNQTDPFNGANDYLDLVPGDEFSGKFIRVPKQIARGTVDGLEDWSNDHNVFQFIRLEDLAYDKNDPNVIYIADTGRSRIKPDPTTGRMFRDTVGPGFADNGSIFKMVLNDKNPKKVDSLTVLAQGDNSAADAFVAIRNPDNMDTSGSSLMVQEDTSVAKIWQHELGTTNWTHVATANESSWETSGIVDVSQWFGSGWWLLDVQGHGSDFYIDSEFDAGTGVTSKLEAGQLLLMNIPGS